MTPEELRETILVGETVSIEFKRCGNQPERDVFETICSFSNRFGGNIVLGICDDGSIPGIEPKTLPSIKRNIINVVHNPNVFSPPPTLEFETIAIEGKQVLRIWVPMSPAVHTFKGTVYDRSEDADIALHHEAQISMLYLRKQNIYTEQRVYRYLAKDDLRLDKLEYFRKRAEAKRPDHPWLSMSDDELLKSAQLYIRDYDTGVEGYTLAAALLLGRDDVIASLCPSYKTDAVVRRENLDRYDDRIVVTTNIVDAYDQLAAFCRKHLPDRFHLEGDQATSPRDIIVRELVSNTLMHREYSSPYPAKIVIGADALVSENASRALFQGRIDPSSFNPMPKNPIIGRFFSQIGLAEELGSGTHNLFKYTQAYSGADPILEEGDVFKAVVPLQSNSSKAIAPGIEKETIDLPAGRALSANRQPNSQGGSIEYAVVSMAQERGYAVAADVSKQTGTPPRTVQRALAKMVEAGLLVAQGNTRAKKYYLRTR